MTIEAALARIRSVIAAGNHEEAIYQLSQLTETYPAEPSFKDLLWQLRKKTGMLLVNGKVCPVCRSHEVYCDITNDTVFGYKQFFLRCSDCAALFDEAPREVDYGNVSCTANPGLDLKVYLERDASPLLFTHLLLQATRARKALCGADGPGRLVEVGCGPGMMVDIARFLGWKSVGIEPSIEAGKLGRRLFGAPIIRHEVRNQLPIRPVDVIMASHLIEHFPSPRHFLWALRKGLATDGVVLLITPNIASRSFAARRESWPHIGPGEHFVLYSPESLERAMRDAGFHGVATYTINGTYQDEDLVCLATLREPGLAFYRTVLHTFPEDPEARHQCMNYLQHHVSRTKDETSPLWLGSRFRTVELHSQEGEHRKVVEKSDRLEAMMVARGLTETYVDTVLEEARQRNDRSLVYDRLPTILPNLYYLRGLARQRDGEAEASLSDLTRACKLWQKIEALPNRSWTEVAGVPPSMNCLFSLGVSFSLCGQNDEARQAFQDILARSEEIEYAYDFLANTFYRYGCVQNQLGDVRTACNSLEIVETLYKRHGISRETYLASHRLLLELGSGGRGGIKDRSARSRPAEASITTVEKAPSA